LGNTSLYWTFAYAVECSLAARPPSAAAVLKRAELLKRIGDIDVALKTLQYGSRIAPKSPAMKMALAEQLDEALLSWEKRTRGGDRPSDRALMYV
jgi:hypothetical protein